MSRNTAAALALALLVCAPAAAPAQDVAPPKEEKKDVPPADAFPTTIPADTEIVTTASGLKYSVLKTGTGTTSPKLGDPVVVSYAGWLESGKMFDASANHGGQATFIAGHLIEGWNEALQLMHAGDRWKLTIPAKIGYGEQGSPPDIAPGATLVFVMELHDFWAFAKKTESGLGYETIKEGTGDPVPDTYGVEIRFSARDAEAQPDPRIQNRTERARRSDFAVPFLKEALGMMRAGSRMRFMVPSALTKVGDRNPMFPTTTYWDIELVQAKAPLPVPAFAMPEDAKLTKTGSGLAYEVIKEGSGTPPKLSDSVEAHYAGWLTDGTPFDSSYAKAFPVTFKLTNVVPGWREGLQLMKPGAIYKFVIPAELGYGPRAMPGIPANSPLVFQVELVGVK